MSKWAEKTEQQLGHIPILSLDELFELPQEPEEFESGIYFLWRDKSLFYIGKSRNLPERKLRQFHVNRYGALYTDRHQQLPYNRYTYLSLEKGQFAEPGLDKKLHEYERAYIAHYRTYFNNLDDNGGT